MIRAAFLGISKTRQRGKSLVHWSSGSTNRVKFCNIASSMSIAETVKGKPLSQVVSTLHSFAEPSLAESWDNVGLLLEPTEAKCVKRVLLTNDLTEQVLEECVDTKIDLIVSYHPPIFAPLKSVTTRTWKERIVAKCLENKIALYSPHISFDAIKGGVNDWLSSAFDLKNSQPIQPLENPENGMGRFCTLKRAISIDEAVLAVKKLTNLPYVRLARPQKEKAIKSVALCAGSGSSVLKGVKADLYLTGEMLHHDVLDAVVGQQIYVILTNHSDSERGFLKEFSKILTNKLENQVFVCVSQVDADPLRTV